MKKTLLICALAAALTGCVVPHDEDEPRYRYASEYDFRPAYEKPVYEYRPAYDYRPSDYKVVYESPIYETTTTTCCAQQPVVCPCMSCARPEPQPKTVVVVVPPAPQPQPQPVIEQEIIYQPRHTCGCKKCGCAHNK